MSRYNYSQVGNKGIVYDGVSLSDYFIVTKLSVTPLPEITASSQSMAGGVGEAFSNIRLGTKTISMTVRFDAESKWSADQMRAWREVSHVICKSEPKKLQLNEDIYINAILTDRSEIEAQDTWGQVDLTFTAYDPYFYAAEEKSISLTANGTKTVNIASGVEVWPAFEVVPTGSKTDLKITNTSTGEYIKVPSLTGTTKAIITTDPNNRKVLIGGSYYEVDLASTFFSLAAGQSKIAVSGASSATMTYRGRWL